MSQTSGRSLVTRSPAARSLVAIDGIDGSGKSRFAAALAAAAAEQGLPAIVLQVDDFRRPVDFDAAGSGDEAARYYDRYYDFAALDATLRSFLAGAGRAAIPRFDERRSVLEGTTLLGFDGAELAIVEGVFVLRARALDGAPLIALQIDEAEARRRIVGRDRAKGRKDAEIARRIDRRYFPAWQRYRAAFAPETRADALLDNRDWQNPRWLRQAPERFPPALRAALAGLVVTSLPPTPEPSRR